MRYVGIHKSITPCLSLNGRALSVLMSSANLRGFSLLPSKNASQTFQRSLNDSSWGASICTEEQSMYAGIFQQRQIDGFFRFKHTILKSPLVFSRVL